MHTWLIEVSRQLLSLDKLELKKRLVSGIVLTCCFYKLSHFFDNIQCEDYLIMLRMMSLSINDARDELSYLQSLMVANDTKLVQILLLLFLCTNNQSGNMYGINMYDIWYISYIQC